MAVAAIACLAVSATPALAYLYPTQTFYTRYDMWGTDFLWGNLTWKNGQGRIVWGPATSENTDALGGGGTPSPEVEAQWQLDDDLRGETGERLAPLPGPDEFTSDPIPRKLFLNVTRGVSLELQLKKHPQAANPCTATYHAYSSATADNGPELDVEMKAAGRYFAGGMGYGRIYWTHANPGVNTKPPDPEGFSTCRFGMSPEASILEEGTVLTLKILHVEQNHFFPYGFGPEHPSVIRLPLYPLEEILFRYPEEVTSEFAPPEEEDEPGPAKAQSDLALGGAGLLALVAVGCGSRRRGLSLALTVVLVATAMAGCLTGGKKDSAGGASDELQGRLDETRIKVGEGELAGAGLGSVIGEVFDDMHVPVKGVHVSIIGFPNFTTTDSKGRFKFLNLMPNTYKLRFDHVEFLSFEAAVKVDAGFVSKPSIMIVYKDQKGKDFRLHNHDYWTGQPNPKQLLNEKQATSCVGSPTYCYVPTLIRLAPKGEDPMIIPPGTNEVEVTFTFDPAKWGGVTELGLVVRSTLAGVNYSIYAPRASDVPFRVATTWEMSDRGHSPFSAWSFYYFIPHRQQPSYVEARQSYYSPPNPVDELTAKVIIRKGLQLPLEAAHPDHWGDKSLLDISKDYAMAATWVATQVPGTPTWTNVYGKAYCAVQKVIPEGTKWIEITVKQARASSPAFEWDVKYKPTNVPSYETSTTTWEGYSTSPRSVNFDGAKSVWRIPLKPENTDFVYGKTSTWSVYFTPNDLDAWWKDQALQTYGQGQANAGALGLQCSIKAFRTPM